MIKEKYEYTKKEVMQAVSFGMGFMGGRHNLPMPEIKVVTKVTSDIFELISENRIRQNLKKERSEFKTTKSKRSSMMLGNKNKSTTKK